MIIYTCKINKPLNKRGAKNEQSSKYFNEA